MTALDAMSIGQWATLVSVQEPGEVGERLLEMGFCAGTRLRLLRRGLFGDPLLVYVRGTTLSLRRTQARMLIVRPEKK